MNLRKLSDMLNVKTVMNVNNKPIVHTQFNIIY